MTEQCGGEKNSCRRARYIYIYIDVCVCFDVLECKCEINKFQNRLHILCKKEKKRLKKNYFRRRIQKKKCGIVFFYLFSSFYYWGSNQHMKDSSSVCLFCIYQWLKFVSNLNIFFFQIYLKWRLKQLQTRMHGLSESFKPKKKNSTFIYQLCKKI